MADMGHHGRRQKALLLAECLHNRHNGGHQTELPESFRGRR